MMFLVLVCANLFMFCGSIYGFFVSELNIGLGASSSVNLQLTGWVKNTTCVVGLLFSSSVMVYPLVSAVYKALLNANS